MPQTPPADTLAHRPRLAERVEQSFRKGTMQTRDCPELPEMPH